MTIVLTYTTEDGSQEQVEFEDDVSKIDLREKGIKDINLDPVANCSTLKELVLSDNHLQSIDLTPLASCTNLHLIELYENQLQSIDLFPLTTCSSILELSLRNNRLQSIDLTPLSSCSSLQYLSLASNRLRTIDLFPLASCIYLQGLYLSENPLYTIDLTPLSSCVNLLELAVDDDYLDSIDLAPLKSCTRLQLLSLHDNKLQTLDLSPLAACTSLQELFLWMNQLQSIDLSPLAACTSLQILELSYNKLQTLDLSPLASCTSLKVLSLGSGQPTDLSPLTSCTSLKVLSLTIGQSTDLSPLTSCTSLKELSLGSNQPTDLSPLISYFYPQKLSLNGDFPGFSPPFYSWLPLSSIQLAYERPKGTYSWQFLHHVAQEYGTDRLVQQDILHALGLQRYGFIDRDLRDVFLSIPVDTPDKEVKERLIEILVEDIAASVAKGGPTTGLKLDEMLDKHSAIAASAQKIIDLRKMEIEQVSIGLDKYGVNLRELWCTAYGYEILTALHIPLTTESKGLEQIKTAFTEVGLQLKIGESSVSGVKMSDELKQAIWLIIVNTIDYPIDRDFEDQDDALFEYESREIPKIIARFERYLNGPIGRTVLDNLQEGENSILESFGYSFEVIKRRGKAIVIKMRP